MCYSPPQSSSNHSIKSPPFRQKTDDLPTRHPTTTKKKEQQSASFRRTQQHDPNQQIEPAESTPKLNRANRLRWSLMTLQDEKNKCLESGRYMEASNIQSNIHRTRSLMNRAELRRLQKGHRQQKKSIQTAYYQQLACFERAWENYFHLYKIQRKTKIEQLRLQETQELEFIREKLNKKFNSLRHPNRQILDLEKEERYHLKEGNILELMLIRKQKKKLITQVKRQRNELINKWTQIEGEQLERNKSKRYSILLGRLEEQRRDQEKNFVTQRKILKKKYKNILSQLRHQKIMAKNFLVHKHTEI